MRRPLCALAIAALIAVWVIPASAIAATTATPGGGSSLLEGLGGGSGSSAGGGATEEGEGEEGTEASKRTGTSSSEESNGFSSLPIIFGMGGAAVLIAAIAFFVLRDAHKNAPVPEGALEGSATRMSPAHVRKRRSKAKAVKQQRKRNRPR